MRHDLGGNGRASVHPSIIEHPLESAPTTFHLILLKMMDLSPSSIATMGQQWCDTVFSHGRLGAFWWP